MSVRTTETFLPLTTYGTPSGNYDGTSPDFVGNAIIGSSYYGGLGSVQTAIVTTTSFVGKITFWATLSDLHEQAVWFELDTIGDGTTPLSDTTTVNLVGNFVWIRTAVTEFTAGTINSATLVF